MRWSLACPSSLKRNTQPRHDAFCRTLAIAKKISGVELPNVQVCDATDDDSSTKAGQTIP